MHAWRFKKQTKLVDNHNHNNNTYTLLTK